MTHTTARRPHVAWGEGTGHKDLTVCHAGVANSGFRVSGVAFGSRVSGLHTPRNYFCVWWVPGSERRENNSNKIKGYYLKAKARVPENQGHSLAPTVLNVASLLDCGAKRTPRNDFCVGRVPSSGYAKVSVTGSVSPAHTAFGASDAPG